MEGRQLLHVDPDFFAEEWRPPETSEACQRDMKQDASYLCIAKRVAENGVNSNRICPYLTPVFCISQDLYIFSHDFMHILHLMFHISHKLHLCLAAVQIVMFPVDTEICIAVQVICQESHAAL